jgi:hypothetical protein
MLMRARSRTYVALLVLVVSLVVVTSAYAAYWFFQGNLSGTVFHNAESTGANQYSRMSFDNTNHPGHWQYIVLDDAQGNWTRIGAACSGGSGCDTGALGPFEGDYYTKGGCQVPSSYGYSVYTNCRYGTGQ